jgi:hypothetical protein
MTIPQSELERLDSLNQQIERIRAERDLLRESILERHRAGGAVEPGRLGLDIKESRLRLFTYDEMVRICGPEEAERLRDLLVPRIQVNVKIIKSR